MSINVTFNGTAFVLPETNEEDWGQEVTSFFQAIAAGSLTRDGGTKSLLSELDTGASYGLKSLYLKSRTANPADAGTLRLANNEGVGWRNAANTDNLTLKVNASNLLEYAGGVLATAGEIDNADIAPAAAIAYSKLSLTDSVVNADIATAAGIAYSKLSLTSSLVNADVSAAAAIALNKLAATTASRALVSDGSGVISASAVTATEISYLDGVTSALQTQLDGKEATLTVGTTSQYIKGDKSLGTLATDVAATAAVTANTAKVSADGSIGTHSDVAITSPTTGEVLKYDGSGWINSEDATAAINTATSAKSADYTVTDVDAIRTILMTTGATDRTVTLPTAAANTDRILTIKKVDVGAGTVTVDGEGAETIDGVTTYTLTSEDDAVTLQCDGAGWETIGRDTAATSTQPGLVKYGGDIVYASNESSSATVTTTDTVFYTHTFTTASKYHIVATVVYSATSPDMRFTALKLHKNGLFGTRITPGINTNFLNSGAAGTEYESATVNYVGDFAADETLDVVVNANANCTLFSYSVTIVPVPTTT